MTEQRLTQSSLTGFEGGKRPLVRKEPEPKPLIIVLNQSKVVEDKECPACHGHWTMTPVSFDKPVQKNGRMENITVHYQVGCQACGPKTVIGLVPWDTRFVKWEEERRKK